MATVTTNFSTFSTLSNAYSTLATTLRGFLSYAVVYGQAAWDYANYFPAQSIMLLTSSRFNAVLSNGDTIDLTGSGFLGATWQATSMNYTFDPTHSVQMSGNVTLSPDHLFAPSGSLTQVVYRGPQQMVTLQGFDNVSLVNDTSLTKVTALALNGAGTSVGSITLEGAIHPETSIVGGTYSPTVSGTVTKATYTFGGQSMVFSNISWDINSMPDTTSVVEALTWALIGNDAVTGSIANDVLYGFGGDDTLTGGAGADSLYGGIGDDTYNVDNSADVVFEDVNQGIDTVAASVSFYLYDNIENLTLAMGAGSIFGSANALSNAMTGNEGDNLLLGWDGKDTINGGVGNDILFGLNGEDSLNGGAGIDFLLGGLGNDLLDGGDNPDEMYGEDGNDLMYGGTGLYTDIMVGGAGNDTLDGSASAASGQPRNQGDYDLMYGGTGDDTYYVDTPADLVFEFNGLTEGNDSVIADINGAGYYLYDGIENLTLINNTAFGVGNALDNTITGNAQGTFLLGGAGNDTINGKQGNDVLFGEAGADTFVFERGTGGDVIGDFQQGQDKIKLVGVGYSAFADLAGHTVQNGNVGAIDLGAGDFIVLHNVQIASLTSADFIFA